MILQKMGYCSKTLQKKKKIIDLKQIYSQIVLQKNVFIQEQQRIAIWGMLSNNEWQASLKKQRKGDSFPEKKKLGELL